MKVRICPSCKKQNLENAFNCASCGTTLSVNTLVEIELAQTEETPSSGNAKSATTHPHREQETRNISSSVKVEKFFCINCGVELPGESKFCWKCGTQVHTYSNNFQITVVEQAAPNSLPAVRQTESRSISCAMNSCNKPVIGQCRSCGRYYCANHNIGALCLDCGRQKAEKDKYLDYLQTAENVKHETDKGYSQKKPLTALVIGVGVFFLAVSFMCGVLDSRDIGSSMCMGTVCLLLIAQGIFQQRYQSNSRRKRAITRATQIDLSKPGFLNFYEAYDPEISFQDELKEMFTSGGKFALSITGLVVGSIAQDEKEASKRAQLESMVSNAVDDELKRHGL